MRKFLPLLLLCLLPACIDAPTPPKKYLPNYTRYQKIYFTVGKIEVLEEYRSPMRAPNVEHTMPYSPADAVHLWARDRLRASGGEKTLQVIIRDGSVIEKDLRPAGGLSGLLSTEPDHRYDARLELELRVYGDGALSEANASVIATQMLTLHESESAAKREQKFRAMLDALMASTNAELEKNIYQYLGAYVDTARIP